MTISLPGKFTPENCLSAVAAWLEEELMLTPGQSRLADIDGRLWLDYSAFASSDPHAEDLPHYLRGVLLARAPAATDAPLSGGEALIVTLHDKDPTPVTEATAFGSQTTRPLSGHAVAVLGFRGNILVARARAGPSEWGSRIRWPF